MSKTFRINPETLEEEQERNYLKRKKKEEKERRKFNSEKFDSKDDCNENFYEYLWNE